MRPGALAPLILLAMIASMPIVKAQTVPSGSEGDIPEEFLDEAGLGELVKTPDAEPSDAIAEPNDSTTASEPADAKPEPEPVVVTVAEVAPLAKAVAAAPRPSAPNDELKKVAANLAQWKKRLAIAEEQAQATKKTAKEALQD